MKHYAILAVAVTAAFLGGSAYWVWSARNTDPLAQCRGGQVGGGEIGGPFTMVNQNGETVTEADVLTQPSLVYFGYTFCPDVCPLDMSRNVEAVDILEEMGFDVTPVFVTVDPKRDTVDVVKEYAELFHPRAIALTGTDDQVSRITKAYKAFYRVPETTDANYLVDHSTFTYLMLPGSGFADFFRRDATPDQMADKVSCFLEAG
ncbi:MAG: SCO family protein [Pseudorhodobacter sp.]